MEPHAPAPGARDPDRLLWPLVTAGLLALLLLSFPPVSVESDADTSLGAVLHYSQQHGVQFGTEVVFTYGPLGFLLFPGCAPYAVPARMGVDVVLCLIVAAGLCLLAWRLNRPWRALPLLVFAWAASNISSGPDLVFEAGLLSWGWLCFLRTGRGWLGCGLVFTALAAFGALAKNSLLFVGGTGVVLLALDAGLRDRRAGLAVLGSFVGLFTAGWLVSGQHLQNVVPFVAHSLVLAQSYNSALGVEAPPRVVQAGFLILLLLGVLALLRSGEAFPRQPPLLRLRRLCRLGFLALLAFGSWKHGFVRGDPFHVVLFLGLAPVLVLAPETVPSQSRILHRCAGGLGLLIGVVAVVTLQTFYFAALPVSLLQPWRGLESNLWKLTHPAAFEHDLAAGASSLRAQAQLPECRRQLAQAPVDVFGQNQAYALFNDLNYRPRPVCQSYAACSAPLMQLNEEQFYSDAAARYYLFELRALDRKFPPLEDAWLLRDLLDNCQLVTREGPMLLLKRTAATPPRMELVAEGKVRPGERLNLARYGDADYWLELRLSPTLAGWARQFAFRPSLIRLAAWGDSGKLLYRHQAAASMLSAGFLASPLLLRTEDVLAWFSTNSLCRPRAYSVELAEADPFWQPAIHFRLYRLEHRGRASLALATRADAAAGMSARAAGASGRPTPFFVFRNPRWHPGEEVPGGWRDMVSYAAFVLLPLAAGGGLALFARRQHRRKQPARWPQLLLGNALVLVFFLSLLHLVAETYFRFGYDTTDSLGYTKVCQRWVQRHWLVNQAGCRDNLEYSPTLTPGRRRISFVGDSFTAGHGIKDVEDRFPNRLRRAHPETEIHVLANVGLDTGDEILLLKHLLTRGYQFDQVVLVYCLNDIGDLIDQQSAAYQEMVAGLGQGGWLTANSYALNLVYHHYRARQNPYLRDYGRFVRDAYRGPLWERQKQRLKELRQVVESHGGHLAVVTFPFLDTLGPNYPYAFVHEELDQFWREQQVPHLDLLSVYQGLPPRALVVNAYDAHPNERANQLAAQALEPFLFGNQHHWKTLPAISYKP